MWRAGERGVSKWHLQALVAAEAPHGARAVCRKADGQVDHAWRVRNPRLLNKRKTNP